MVGAPVFVQEIPSSPDSPLYTCEWCCRGFTGAISKDPVCPYCERTGDGVRRIDQSYVVRRIIEAAEHTVNDDEYRDATEIARLQKHAELDIRYWEVRPPMAETKTEEKPKAEKKEKVKNDCACGCETKTGATWAPGHDARFYGAIRKRNAGKMTATEVGNMFPAATIKKFEGNVKDHGG